MHLHNNEDEQHTNPDESGPAPETEPHDTRPRVYVASLSDYNAGRLHGEWLDAVQPIEDLHAEVQAMLERSPEPWAEEYAIHDYEGWSGWRPGEYTPLNDVVRVAAGLAIHGPAFGHWVDYWGEIDDDTEERFERAYRGEWPSLEAYAEDLIEEIGLEISVQPESWSHYVRIDSEQLARDLSFDLVTAESESGVYVFDPMTD